LRANKEFLGKTELRFFIGPIQVCEIGQCGKLLKPPIVKMAEENLAQVFAFDHFSGFCFTAGGEETELFLASEPLSEGG